MSSYSTNQRKILLEFFQKNTHSSFSAKQIKEELENIDISMSAIYRNLILLEKNGFLQKVQVSDKKETVYQYTDLDHCANLIHLICDSCKKSYHFEQDFSDLIVENALQEKGFMVNKQRTFINGICKLCSSSNKKALHN